MSRSPVIPFTLSGSTQAIKAGNDTVLYGWDLHSASNTSTVVLHAEDASGQVLFTIPIASGGNSRILFPIPGVSCRGGLHLAKTGSGTLTGTVFTAG